jgi:Flp pilus assembly pilin Flp
MNRLMMKLYLKLQALREERGQDMIEYILVGGVVALGAVAGMTTFANDVNNAFTTLGGKLASYS